MKRFCMSFCMDKNFKTNETKEYDKNLVVFPSWNNLLDNITQNVDNTTRNVTKPRLNLCSSIITEPIKSPWVN